MNGVTGAKTTGAGGGNGPPYQPSSGMSVGIDPVPNLDMAGGAGQLIEKSG